MSDKTDSHESEDQRGYEWHLEFGHMPDFPYPFPVVPFGTRPKHDPVGHLSNDGKVHVFNRGIIEQLVRAGLRVRVRRDEATSDTRNEVAGWIEGLYREGSLVKALDASGQPITFDRRQVYKYIDNATAAEREYWRQENRSH